MNSIRSFLGRQKNHSPSDFQFQLTACEGSTNQCQMRSVGSTDCTDLCEEVGGNESLSHSVTNLRNPDCVRGLNKTTIDDKKLLSFATNDDYIMLIQQRKLPLL